MANTNQPRGETVEIPRQSTYMFQAQGGSPDRTVGTITGRNDGN